MYYCSLSNDTLQVDISSLLGPLLARYNAALWLMSPSCQPYTVLNPDAKGAEDPRAKSFIHLMQTVLPELVAMGKQPTHLLVENVAGFEVPFCPNVTAILVLMTNLNEDFYYTTKPPADAG